ncbi:ATP-binding protein [uncultured Meiothermus sp.]|jgi:signal transduction histidine kinase|uniref:sensor histidine kinase n=1 Tax=uncultured Meiothermus sp. TaxID=157471 RepID=UPI0026081373|nr:ATP-binding protein [uncultured Meiothermus sp.]
MSLSPADLRTVPALADLPEAGLQWLIDHGKELRFKAGQAVLRDGDPPDWMLILLEGSLEFRWADSSDALYDTGAGDIVGALPYSRMQQYNGTGWARADLHCLAIHRQDFASMLEAIPQLTPRLVGILLDRVRYVSRLDFRMEKLASLGKLSAGLAHELGNPTAAATRAALELAEALTELQTQAALVTEQIGVAGLRDLLGHLQILQPTPLSGLKRADLEDKLAAWLEPYHIHEAEEWADAGATVAWLEGLQSRTPAEALPAVLTWMRTAIRTQGMVRLVQETTQRISRLVMAVKRYTFMDQAPKQAVDVVEGLENTLLIFGHRLKRSIQVLRDYAPDLPRVWAFGTELNQVWTNLIDNALDAMGEAGTLTIRIVQEGNFLLVEIGDSGPGIPAEIQGRIFDPFFTTKEVGRGTGLGLEMVRRIVQGHDGTIRVESRPGDTRFQVRLPLLSAEVEA